MKIQHITRFGALMDKASLTRRSKLILARWIARQICSRRMLSELRPMRNLMASKQAPVDKPGLTNKSGAKGVSDRLIMSDIGKWLCENDEQLTEEYGFDGLCDVLHVNPVHRSRAAQQLSDTGRGVAGIVYVWGLEDSASALSGRNSAELKEGPLYQALFERLKQIHLDAVRRRD